MYLSLFGCQDMCSSSDFSIFWNHNWPSGEMFNIFFIYFLNIHLFHITQFKSNKKGKLEYICTELSWHCFFFCFVFWGEDFLMFCE